ncbi:zf-HC2 domain-containing protein [Actinoplanes sp. NPDC048967]|uniref:zf-HC2 domain-containing protein n=1 Tax=Actinoplanes sp. NPDC048967 TaxID=3155269 RepID=UPI0033D3C83C
MSWHLEEDTWAAYAAGRLDPVAEASVETHVSGCPQCRNAARSTVPAAHTTAIWDAVRTSIAEPVLPAPLRLLRRLGVPAHDLVVVSAAHSLLVPWAASVGFAVVAACLVGLTGLGPADRDATFLVLAPLVPVLAVVLAYDALDPLREVGQVTPYSKLRLALLRATATLAVAAPATLAVGLVVPGMQDLAFVWLLPSLGLTTTALALLNWLRAAAAAAIVAGAWVGVVGFLRYGGNVLLLTSAPAQFAAVGLALAAGVLLLMCTSTLRLQGGHR